MYVHMSSSIWSGKVSVEREVSVSADVAWKLWGSLELGKMVVESLPHYYNRIDVVEGDGGTGTVIELFLTPGSIPGMRSATSSYKEKYTLIDDANRVKEVEVLEGGYLDAGFVSYRVIMEVVKKKGKDEEEDKACILRTTIEFGLREEAASNAYLVSVQPMIDIMELARRHLMTG